MIYVDDMMMEAVVDNNGRQVKGKWSHLFSDSSIEELNDFAQKIGLKKEWLQNDSCPHYDLVESKRLLALKMGAKPIKYGTGEKWVEVYEKACCLNPVYLALKHLRNLVRPPPFGKGISKQDYELRKEAIRKMVIKERASSD